MYSTPPSETCSGITITNSKDEDFGGRECVVRVLLKKNAWAEMYVVLSFRSLHHSRSCSRSRSLSLLVFALMFWSSPSLFPSIPLAPLPVTVHQYLAELSGTFLHNITSYATYRIFVYSNNHIGAASGSCGVSYALGSQGTWCHSCSGCFYNSPHVE